MAFQLAADLLDYTFDSRILGKAVGADLREGKLTLPVIHALKQAGGRDEKHMREIIRDGNFSDADFEWLVGRLRHYGGLAYTAKLAAEHVAGAKESLAIFEDSADRRILLDIADYSIMRKQ